MLVTADWVLPIARPPIRDGAVMVKGHKIAEVGRAADLAERNPSVERHDLPGHVLIPGLVNAHTHLSLTVLGGLLPRSDMEKWLRRLVKAIRALDADDLAASAALGAARCIACGATTVGDIAYGPEAPAAASDAGMAGVFFWEVLGISESELPETLAEREYPTDPALCHGRVRCGLSPHSPYTSGPGLIRATAELARRQGAAWAIHLAESDAETRLLVHGDGPLESQARRLALGFRPARTSPVAYVDRLGALEGAVAVHCTRASRQDAERLARVAGGVVLCPRSNAFLGNGEPPVNDLVRAGVRLGLGTDSSASNDDLDLFEEARALRAIAPKLPADRALEMMTIEGARVLGMQDRVGALGEGKDADLVAVRVSSTDRPIETVLAEGGRGTVSHVMTSGIWRFLDGKPAFESVTAAERHAAAARSKAEAALRA